jgi:hypothetical protein
MDKLAELTSLGPCLLNKGGKDFGQLAGFLDDELDHRLVAELPLHIHRQRGRGNDSQQHTIVPEDQERAGAHT